MHTWRWGSSRSRPHARTEASWLVKGGAESALVLGELLHRVRVVVMGRGGVDWRATVLWWRSWGWVVHIGGHLAHDVARWWSDWRGS